MYKNRKVLNNAILFIFLIAILCLCQKSEIRITNEDLKYGYEWDIIYQDSTGHNYQRHEIIRMSEPKIVSQAAIERIGKMIKYDKMKWIVILNITENK